MKKDWTWPEILIIAFYVVGLSVALTSVFLMIAESEEFKSPLPPSQRGGVVEPPITFETPWQATPVGVKFFFGSTICHHAATSPGAAKGCAGLMGQDPNCQPFQDNGQYITLISTGDPPWIYWVDPVAFACSYGGADAVMMMRKTSSGGAR